jgi:hypothetical protein
VVPDFRKLDGFEGALTGYDACVYCAGVSSVGMNDADYPATTYETPLKLAQAVARLSPNSVPVHYSGAHTDVYIALCAGAQNRRCVPH